MMSNEQPDVRAILEKIKANDTPENKLRQKEEELKNSYRGAVVLIVIILALIAFISYR